MDVWFRSGVTRTSSGLRRGTPPRLVALMIIPRPRTSIEGQDCS